MVKSNDVNTNSIFRFLQSRSSAFLSDDYYQSDKDWMDLDSKIEVTIGPYEVTFFLLAKKKKYEVTSLFNPQQQLLNL